MGENRGSLAGIAIISIIIGAGLGFGLTWLVQPSGSVLKTQYLSVRSLAAKNDNDLTKTVVPGTAMNISTGGLSYLVIDFSGSLGYHLDASFTSVTRFNITLEVDNIVVATHIASWYHGSASGTMEEGSIGVSMRWVSGTMAAGVHDVKLKWVSTIDATGANQIYFSTPTRNTTRTITVQEIRSGLF
ncbi:MAG: hypothetical protein GYA24_22415 [Candidatus Lokiarchaeota archaeon]|nr:hypothetical protein [Candidatus Lokiarchaeota archaeon]